jgi:DUF1680 family protein
MVWTACCPSNIARLVESLGNYIYASSANQFWVNLFIESNTQTIINNNKVEIAQQTNYPWEGTVRVSVSPEKKTAFALHIRIPGWAKNQPSPGNTYKFLNDNEEKWTLSVNGKKVPYNLDKGYIVIEKNLAKRRCCFLQYTTRNPESNCY